MITISRYNIFVLIGVIFPHITLWYSFHEFSLNVWALAIQCALFVVMSLLFDGNSKSGD